MRNYLLRLVCTVCFISCASSAPTKRNAEQMLQSETTGKRMNVERRHTTEFSSNEGAAYNTYGDSSPNSVSSKQKVSQMLKPETAEERMNFEQAHQKALSSNPELYRTWHEIHNDPYSECHWLLRKIFPQKSLSNVNGKIVEVTLIYKHIKDENNKPFPQMTAAALLCQFPQKCRHGTTTIFIRSPDPNCAYYMNHLASKSNAYFITEEICKWNIYPRFWDTVLDGQRRPKDHPNPLYRPDRTYQQEKHERKHRQCYLAKTVKYQVWPELEHEDTQLYCHVIFEKFLPGTVISISDIKSKHLQIELSYKRIKNENGDYFPPHKVCAFFCNIPHKFHVSSYKFIRSPNLNCLYLVRMCQSSSTDYRISREICDQKLQLKIFYENIELGGDISDTRRYVHE